MNKKGFTLVELLAVLIILGIILMVAVPNTVSILDKNKKKTYISDAKRFVGLVEAEVRKDDSLDVEVGNAMVFYLNYINDGTFDEDPDGEEYIDDQSFVAVIKEPINETGTYTYRYYVYLKGGKRELKLTSVSSLNDDNALKNVDTTSNLYNPEQYTIGDILDRDITNFNKSKNVAEIIRKK